MRNRVERGKTQRKLDVQQHAIRPRKWNTCADDVELTHKGKRKAEEK